MIPRWQELILQDRVANRDYRKREDALKKGVKALEAEVKQLRDMKNRTEAQQAELNDKLVQLAQMQWEKKTVSEIVKQEKAKNKTEAQEDRLLELKQSVVVQASEKVGDPTTVREADRMIVSLQQEANEIKARTLNAAETVRKDPRVQAAQKEQWRLEDEGRRFEGMVQYRKVYNQVFAEMYPNGVDTDTSEIDAEIKRLKDIRDSLYQMPQLTDADYKKLISHFGVTKNFANAGYILPDGSALDLRRSSSSSAVYHSEVDGVIDMGYETSPRNVMINNGSIRLVPETNGINLTQMLNAKQLTALRGYIRANNGNVHVDVDNIKGVTVETFSYWEGASPDTVIADLQRYFETGERQKSVPGIRMFYSEKVTTAEKETDAQKKAARVYVEYKNRAEFDRRFADTFAAIKAEGRTVKIQKSDLPAPSDILKGGKTNPERTVIKELIRSLYGNDTISFQRNGKRVDAYFTKDGKSHTAGGNNSNAKANLIRFVREIAASAQYAFSSWHDDHSFESNGKQIAWDYFCAVFDVADNYGEGGTKYDILFTLRDIETDKREQIYKAEIEKETPYRHENGTAVTAVDATSNYTDLGVSEENDTTVSSELQASEKTGDRSDLEVLQQAYADSVETPEQEQAMVSFREQVQRYEDARSALAEARKADKESTPETRKAKLEAQRTFNREEKILAGMVNNNRSLRKVINTERKITTKAVNTADREAFNAKYCELKQARAWTR